jgi:Tol biopolymer transport system component
MHAMPAFLPDGKHFLFAIVSQVTENAGIYVASLDDPKMRTRLAPLPNPIFGMGYVEPGYFVLAGAAVLTAQRFDLKTLTLSGEPRVLIDGLVNGTATFSNTGLLFYRKSSGNSANKQLTEYDRSGKQIGQIGAVANYGSVELSRGGDRAAVDIITNNNRDIWVVDLARGVPSRISFDNASDWSPSWSADDSRLVYASSRSGANDIYAKASTGIGAEELVYESAKVEIPVAWSRDARHVVFSRTRSAGTGNDTWLLELPGKKESAFIESPFDKIHARISPDGRWIAYSTNDSGMYQIVVQSFPDPNGGKWQITAEGGVEPKWRRDGSELYYLALDGKLMAVPVTAERSFKAGNAVALFQTPLTVARPVPSRDRRYDVTADGRFIMVTPIQSAVEPVTVVVNWAAELEKE